MTTDGTGGTGRGPLSGLVVADFSRILAGPYATMLLADLGADVIKVESPGGDDTRTWAPPVRDGVSTYYLGVNRNKRSVALDLTDPGDVAAARSWPAAPTCWSRTSNPAAWPGSDWTTDGGRRQPRRRLRLDQRLRQRAGRTLAARLRPHRAGDLRLMSLTGDPDGDPYRAGVAVFDVMAGLHATIGVLSALNLRRETGRGQHVEVDLLSSALSGWSTRPVPTSPATSSRSGWATATPACSPTNRCRAPTAT
jgi:hypothetical protein